MADTPEAAGNLKMSEPGSSKTPVCSFMFKKTTRKFAGRKRRDEDRGEGANGWEHAQCILGRDLGAAFKGTCNILIGIVFTCCGWP